MIVYGIAGFFGLAILLTGFYDLFIIDFVASGGIYLSIMSLSVYEKILRVNSQAELIVHFTVIGSFFGFFSWLLNDRELILWVACIAFGLAFILLLKPLRISYRICELQ